MIFPFVLCGLTVRDFWASVVNHGKATNNTIVLKLRFYCRRVLELSLEAIENNHMSSGSPFQNNDQYVLELSVVIYLKQQYASSKAHFNQPVLELILSVN